MRHPYVPFLFLCPIFFSPSSWQPHTHTHSLFLPSLWLQYVSWWPRQVTDGDLTALLTVNWVLIKPKHVWEMLIIHYSLREAGVQPREHCACVCACVSLVYNHFPHCDKTIRALLSIYGVAAEKYEAGWTGCLEPPWILQPSGLTVVLTKINTDENSNLILKQSLWKLSWGISNCLSTYLPECGLLRFSTHYRAISENLKLKASNDHCYPKSDSRIHLHYNISNIYLTCIICSRSWYRGKRSSIYNVAIRSQQIIWDSIVLSAPFAALILIFTVLLLIKMALYNTLPIVIFNKMAVKLDFLSCRRADVIFCQRQRSRINSGGGFLMLTVGFLCDNEEKKKRKTFYWNLVNRL